METIKEILDKLEVEYTEQGNSFDIEDVGGTISVLENKAYFVYGNTEPSIAIDHPKLVDWVKSYTEDCDEFGEVIENTESN